MAPARRGQCRLGINVTCFGKRLQKSGSSSVTPRIIGPQTVREFSPKSNPGNKFAKNAIKPKTRDMPALRQKKSGHRKEPPN
tara:strand:+ start:231 stop:476 length:246 start_codon:yes stop_codon:yes gene_type:complete